jgi:hypothetical protein
MESAILSTAPSIIGLLRRQRHAPPACAMRLLNSPWRGVESCIAPPPQRLLFGFAFLGSFFRLLATGALSSFAFLCHDASPPFKVTCQKWYRSEPTCQKKS